MSNIGVFLGSSPAMDKVSQDIAAKLGDMIASAGHTLVYGGSQNGLMGILAKAALAKAGKVIGILPKCLEKLETPMPGIDELMIVETMSIRKEKLFTLSDVAIILPGGIGTLEECVELLSRIKIGIDQKHVILMNINGFYDPLLTLFKHMANEGFIPDNFFQSFFVAKTLDESKTFLDKVTETMD